MSEIRDNLNSLATKSDWIEKANKRQENKEWLKHSQKIALKVLRTLRKEKISQKNLAEIIGVSPQYVNKIVKGKENLTLETISKLEKALAIDLMGVSKTSEKTEYIYKEKYVYFNIYSSTGTDAKSGVIYSESDVYVEEKLLNESTVSYG
ncbi:MAG: helix-turn-helix transcriptional regulator [Bacteroidales bacterium]|nr:helix-turn-helix transcriptional regulator [Bacteroidales bacterium]